MATERPILVLQVRTCSARLPAKALLPIADTPLVVFVARRAMNTGLKLIAAIPDDKTDDLLADVLTSESITFFRGSQSNVLHRILSAVSTLDDTQCIMRLTADNVLADGRLLDLIYQEFLSRDLEYLTASGSGSGLPKWGTGVEIFRKSSLKQALKDASDKADFESVTPRIKARFGAKVTKKFCHFNLADMRCTIDTLEDYLFVARALRNIDQPETLDHERLLELFAATSPK